MSLNFSLNLSSVKSITVSADHVYDLLIIGAGPAGLNAALYAKRKGLDVAVLAERIGGQLLDTPMVENYLGTSKLSGEALMKQYEDHVREYDVPIAGEVRVVKITLDDGSSSSANGGKSSGSNDAAKTEKVSNSTDTANGESKSDSTDTANGESKSDSTDAEKKEKTSGSGDTTYSEKLIDSPGAASTKNLKRVHASNSLVYQAKTLLLATGTMSKKLGIPGEEEFYGKGVSYCAICDGSFYTGKDVIVVGGGNSAVGAAIDMARIAKSVTVVHRSQFRADQILLDRMNNQENMSVHLQTQVLEIKGDTKVTEALLLDRATGSRTLMAIDGVFIEIGHLPKTACMEGLLDLDENGEVLISDHFETSIPGVFAAGDVTTVPYKQIIVAAADGAKAALRASEYINRHQM